MAIPRYATLRAVIKSLAYMCLSGDLPYGRNSRSILMKLRRIILEPQKYKIEFIWAKSDHFFPLFSPFFSPL